MYGSRDYLTMATAVCFLFAPTFPSVPYNLQCVSPYVGDGSLCVLDSDADIYPDQALRTCTDTDTLTYCSADTCPDAPNPDQADTSPCIGLITGTDL